MHIHYDISKLHVKADKDSDRLTQQWQSVLISIHEQNLGELARARLAFNLVDYITSEDLPLRLLITRAPQAMAKISYETRVYKEYRVINGKKSGVIYSRSEQILPKTVNYTTHYESQRMVDGTAQSLSANQLLDCLKAGDVVTPLDGILFLNCKRIAIDIARLKKRHSRLSIKMDRIEVSDSLTGTTRKMASYKITGSSPLY